MSAPSFRDRFTVVFAPDRAGLYNRLHEIRDHYSDGCADEPQASLGGLTPLQAAKKPHMDRVAKMGVVGRSNNVPETLTPASDVAT